MRKLAERAREEEAKRSAHSVMLYRGIEVCEKSGLPATMKERAFRGW